MIILRQSLEQAAMDWLFRYQREKEKVSYPENQKAACLLSSTPLWVGVNLPKPAWSVRQAQTCLPVMQRTRFCDPRGSARSLREWGSR